MTKDNQTGKFQLNPGDLDYRDVSTVRRMLGGVHEGYVLAAWNNAATLPKLLFKSSSVVEQALTVASSKQ